VRCVLLPGEDLVKQGSSAEQCERAHSVDGSFGNSQGRVEPAVSSVQDVKGTAIGIWGFSDQQGWDTLRKTRSPPISACSDWGTSCLEVIESPWVE
jgi:hypothetical protein